MPRISVLEAVGWWVGVPECTIAKKMATAVVLLVRAAGPVSLNKSFRCLLLAIGWL